MTAATHTSAARRHLDDYLSALDFSVATGMSVESVRRRLRAGHLEHISTPLGRLIPRRALDVWWAEHARPVQDDADA
jgi:hypothetical protein